MNQLSSSMLVTQMRSNRLFGHFFDHDANKPIENTWMDKKFFKLIVLVTGVRVDILE